MAWSTLGVASKWFLKSARNRGQHFSSASAGFDLSLFGIVKLIWSERTEGVERSETTRPSESSSLPFSNTYLSEISALIESILQSQDYFQLHSLLHFSFRSTKEDFIA